MGALRRPQTTSRNDADGVCLSLAGDNNPSRLESSSMHSDHHDVEHHKPKHLAEKFEGMLGYLMIAAIVLLAIGMVYGIMTTDNTPSWMR